MKTDQELTEAAAKAAGIYEEWLAPDYTVQWNDEGLWCSGMGEGELWSPLEDDGDALRLAIQLGIEVVWPEGVTIAYGDNNDIFREDHGDDAYAATRRAIVRAAAAMAP